MAKYYLKDEAPSRLFKTGNPFFFGTNLLAVSIGRDLGL